jgi:hypothetical protein
MQVKTPGGQNSKSSPPSPLWGSVATKTLEGFASGWRPVEELNQPPLGVKAHHRACYEGLMATKTLEGFASDWRPVEELPTASRYVGGDSPNSPPSKPARGLLGGGTGETS